MSVLSRLIPDNPVLTKELRVRMRGARAYWILLGYLGFIAVLVLIRYNSFHLDITTTGSGGSNAASVGSELFAWIMIPQVFLVLFITPAITSGTLTIEREQQTMDLLTMTRLSRKSIVIGKLMSAVSFTALLIISSLPLISICFTLGGVDPLQVFSVYLEMLTASVLIGAMGIMWSSVGRTTTQAVMMTYITLFLMFAFGVGAFIQHFSPMGATAASTAFQAVSSVWFGKNFLGITTPEGVGFAVFCMLFGVLMTAVATVRIEMFPDRKAYILRGLTMLLMGVQFLTFDVWWVNAWFRRGAQAVMVAVQPPIGALILTAIGLMLLVPIFATGELASFEARRFFKYMLWGFTPAGFRRGKLASGLPFLLLTTLLALGVYFTSFVVAGKGSGVNKSGALALGLPGVPPPKTPSVVAKPGETATVNGNTVSVNRPDGTTIQATKLPDGKVQVNTFSGSGQANVQVVASWPVEVPALPPAPPPTNTVTPPTGDFLQGALCLLVSVTGFSLLCMLFSVAFRSRWISVVAAYVVLLLIWIVPEISVYGTPTRQDTAMSANLFYLNPIQTFIQQCEPASYWENRYLWFNSTPMWQVTTVAWGVIGILSFLTMLFFVTRIGKENEPIPYEEQVQLA